MKKGDAAFDVWTFVHAGTGLAMGVLRFSLMWAIVLLVGFEFAEAGLRRLRFGKSGLFEFESWPNIFVDILAGFACFLVAYWAIGYVDGWNGLGG